MTDEIVIVGNGPSVLDSPRGESIDSFKTVVRLNNYTYTPELQHWTGRKTDVWAHHSCPGIVEPEDGLCARRMLVCPWYAGPWGYLWSAHAASAILEGLELIDEKVARLAYGFWGGESAHTTDIWPSTGALVVAHFAMNGGCSIVGFDHFNRDRWHYGDEYRPTSMRHAPEIERDWFLMFERAGLVVRL